MNKKQLRATLLLLLCDFFWGSTFIAQSTAAESLPPFAYLCARSVVGSGALFGIYFLFSRFQKSDLKKDFSFSTLKIGFLCGSALFVASACQQFGITLGTGAGKAGFLTSLYLVFVPILGYMLYRRNPGIYAAGGAGVVLIGLFLLMWAGGSQGGFGIGDIVTACSGLCFAVHILIIDRYAPHVNCIALSCIQFFACALLSLAASFMCESVSFATLGGAAIPILYAGLLSSAFAYTLQIIGQKDCPPAVAAIVMSLESVFALLSDIVMSLIRHKPFPVNRTELFGCTLMLAGVLLAQITPRSQKT